MNMKEQLSQELASIQTEGLYRELRTVSGAPGREITVGGKRFLNFSSNNYLGLSEDPLVKKAAAQALEKYGAGGTSSRLVAGTLEVHRQLEERMAAFKRTEAALVFPSGYQTNVGVISALLSEGDCLVMDRLNHASLWDAAKLARARVFVYDHRDMESLERTLIRAREYRRKLIVTDSIFSMDGDFAPLREITELAGRCGAWTMIDEAHATGIFGENGRGLAEHLGVEGKIDIVMGTLSKALGAQGGYVCGAKALVDYLVNRSRPFIYTTALAPAAAGAALAALEIVEKEPGRRQKLLRLSGLLRDKLQATGFNTLHSESQIVPFLVGPAAETVSLSGKLWRDGIYAPAIRPPTVPAEECRLRFSLTSEHTEEDIRKLFSSIVE